ncbi:MAG: transcriptional regulator [Rhizobium sp.]|nr:transcriptional regulator [Rhizobium sp.]
MLSDYADALRYARRISGRADDAEDILQTVLLSAVKHGRADLSIGANRRWLMGAIRRQVAFVARSAVRRRRRETVLVPAMTGHAEDSDFARACAGLPAALGITARLIGGGHTKQEILWLLGISDMAFRQRIADIRRRLRGAGFSVDNLAGLSGPLAHGLIRRSLISPIRRSGAFLAGHDPDGHLFFVSRPSQTMPARQQGAVTAKES